MDENEPEIHPLDRDYSSPRPDPRLGVPIDFDAKLRRVGYVIFAVGFLTIFPSAIIQSGAQIGSWRESLGGDVHRLALVIILIGGLVIVVSYRLPYLKARKVSSGGLIRFEPTRSYFSLVICNVAAFFVIALLGGLLRQMASNVVYFLVVNSFLTITCGLLATMAVWHRGMLRGYAIGVLVAVLMNGSTGLVYMFVGGMWGNDATLMQLANLSIILISGLICSGYVFLLERKGAEHGEDATSR